MGARAVVEDGIAMTPLGGIEAFGAVSAPAAGVGEVRTAERVVRGGSGSVLYWVSSTCVGDMTIGDVVGNIDGIVETLFLNQP